MSSIILDELGEEYKLKSFVKVDNCKYAAKLCYIYIFHFLIKYFIIKNYKEYRSYLQYSFKYLKVTLSYTYIKHLIFKENSTKVDL